jgi:hypothetical protein
MLSASELANRLARDAEAVCRHYLSAGRRAGNYWIVGDIANSKGKSLYVHLSGPRAGRWAEYVAARVMLRFGDRVLPCRRSAVSTQHNVSTRGIS